MTLCVMGYAMNQVVMGSAWIVVDSFMRIDSDEDLKDFERVEVFNWTDDWAYRCRSQAFLEIRGRHRDQYEVRCTTGRIQMQFKLNSDIS